MLVNFVAPIGDISGYACASRNYAASMIKAGIDLTITAVSFEEQKRNHGSIMDILRPHFNKGGHPEVNIMHMTPENYARFYDVKRRNIALTVWETSKLHPTWIEPLNNVQEIWVPSDWCKQVFRGSGIRPPIHKIPHAIDYDTLASSVSSKKLEGHDENAFLFYSILQWTERKNPLGLLIAYFTEFRHDENVCLILKAYRQVTRSGGSLPDDKQWLREQILGAKGLLHLDRYPKVQLISDPLDEGDLLALHKQGNCFVLCSKAEGFSLGHMEAMCFGKPVIGTNYGGSLEFMNQENSLLVDARETPVFGMPWALYTGDMLWAEPDILDIRRKMRRAFSDREGTKKLAERAAHDIKTKYSWEVIGQLIKERLNA